MKKIYYTNCGIYMITNLIPNEKTGICKVYIGSSENLKSRKYDHFGGLKKNRHSNNYLQKAYNKVKKLYCEDVIKYFEFKVIKEIEKIEDKIKLKEELLKWENIYLKEYKNEDGAIDHDRCYNLSPVAGSPLGVLRSDEFKKKVSERNKGLYPLRNWTQEEVKLYYERMKGHEVSKEVRNKISIKNKGRKRTEEAKEKNRLAHPGKKVINLDTEEKFDSIAKAAKFYNIKVKSHISFVCMGKAKTAGGYKWAYL